MYQGNIGDASTCLNTVVVSVQPGATVTVANATASTGTLSYQSNGLANGPVGTIAAGSNQAFTQQAWLTTTGIASLTITGTGY